MFSSVQIVDNLTAGQSFYLAEVRRDRRARRGARGSRVGTLP